MCRHGSLRYSPLLISLDGVSRFAIELMVLMHCYLRSGKYYVLKVCQTIDSIVFEKVSELRYGSVPFRQIGNSAALPASLVCSSLFSSHTRAVASGSAAVLRGRDCSVSFYRTHARRRPLSQLEPDRELRGRLARPKGGLCSGLKAWQACRALSYRLRQQPKVQQYDRNLQP